MGHQQQRRRIGSAAVARGGTRSECDRRYERHMARAPAATASELGCNTDGQRWAKHCTRDSKVWAGTDVLRAGKERYGRDPADPAAAAAAAAARCSDVTELKPHACPALPVCSQSNMGMPVYHVPPGFSAFDGLAEVDAAARYTGKISLLSLQPARGAPGSQLLWNGTDCVGNQPA